MLSSHSDKHKENSATSLPKQTCHQGIQPFGPMLWAVFLEPPGLLPWRQEHPSLLFGEGGVIISHRNPIVSLSATNPLTLSLSSAHQTGGGRQSYAGGSVLQTLCKSRGRCLAALFRMQGLHDFICVVLCSETCCQVKESLLNILLHSVVFELAEPARAPPVMNDREADSKWLCQ